MQVAISCKAFIFSPYNTPKYNAMIGIVYVTELAKTGVDICTNLLNMTFAIPVPNTAKRNTHKVASIINELPRMS